jgi:single-stranded-DNA-specific exonuclease
MTKEIRQRLRERGDAPSPVTVLGDPDWKPALLGLAANSVLDDRGGIVCIWGRDGVGTLKGSCRSDGSASIVDLFRASADVLIESGGHHASGGFSVSPEQVHTLPAVFAERIATIAREEKSTDLPIAYSISLTQVSEALHTSLSQLAPFGMGNEKPLFALENVQVMSVRQFGKANEHLEVILVDNGVRAKAMDFFATPAQFTTEPKEGSSVTVLATLERSSYRGVIEMRLRLVDIYSPGDMERATIISI